MAPSSRDSSRDRSEVLRHQHSFSESGRSSVPMWDSSDPDRAPPPLPLNPGTSSSPVTRPNTSARIEEAAALITARARESAPSSYTTNPTPGSSPEKGLIKPQHKRMQSIQGAGVRGLSDSLERRSPDKGLRTTKLSDYDEYRNRSPERSPTRSGSETPTPSGRVTPSHLNRPILSENTPPSATMLALQNMRNRADLEAPLTNITNGTVSSRTSLTFDGISSQILSLTSIATNLQREMAQLSRRSKDNASDLISLKEATNSRDEDIRKSLRELVSGLEGNFSAIRDASRANSNLGFYLDNKAHNGSPGMKNFSLPRISSPSSFSVTMDRELTASPSIVSSDGAASIALMEKVFREMGTKEGQEKILKAVEIVKNQSEKGEAQVDPELMKKLEEILTFMKENSGSRALVRATGDSSGLIPPQTDLCFDQGPRSGPLAKTSREVASPAKEKSPGESKQNGEVLNEEVIKTLKRVKQSITEGGGLTNEVKALVRELRGEVLGMGREIARKLEQAESARQTKSDDANGPEIIQTVEAALSELKDHMQELIRENRRKSAALTKSVVDTQEVARAVRSALAEAPGLRQDPARDPEFERNQMLAAVKEAWEECKPEISLEHFGLERDEILETLKEGLKSYQPQNITADGGITYEEVVDAVQKGLANFKSPEIQTEASITREEILMAVRECLESFEFPVQATAPSSNRDLEFTREDVIETIKECLTDRVPVTKQVEFNREDLYNAVKSSLEGTRNPMYEFLDSMKTEFKQYSAASGKDTEQVLDAMKDGFEELRSEIESYVDRAADVTGKDEIIDTVRDGFRLMQADLEKGFSDRNRNRNAVDTPELLDAMEKEFEHLRESISKSLIRASGSADKEEILDAIRDISESDRNSGLSSNSEDIVRLVKEELEHMRTALAGTLVRSGSSLDKDEILDTIREGLDASRNPRRPEGSESILSNTSELLDAFQEGVEAIKSDMKKLMDRPVDLSSSYEILDTLKAGVDNIRLDIEGLRESQKDMSETATARGREVMVSDGNLLSTEIEGLKVMITQLRIKVEALDNTQAAQPDLQFDDQHVRKDDLEDIHSAIKAVHHSVNNFNAAREVPLHENAATKDDTDAIETLLRNVKAKLDDFQLPDAENMARSTQVDSLEDLIRDLKDTLDESAAQAEKNSFSKDDSTMIELLLKEVAAGVEELQGNVKRLDSADVATKKDIEAVETLCLDTKTQLEELLLPDPTNLPTKRDIGGISDSIKAIQDQIEADNELSAQAFESRKVEHAGIATKIDDVRGILSDIRTELLGRLDGSEEGIHELSRLLESHQEMARVYATAESLKELSGLVSKEFDRHLDHHITSKLEAEDRDSSIMAKHEIISNELKTAIEDRFNELMAKYDDAQLASEAKVKEIESKDGRHLEIMTSTKAVADDVRFLIDTLGTTLTETCDRMSDDAKTVYNQVEEANNKLGELREVLVTEHGLSRDEAVKTLAAVSRLESNLSEHQPAILTAVREVLSIVGQHFQHSQQQSEYYARSAEEIRSSVNAIPSAIPPLLPTLPAAPAPAPLTREIPVQKEYDDSQVHDKLNVLISHASGAKEAFAKMENHHQATVESLANMEKLDKIHQQMITTVGEVSAMIATQTRLMAEHHDSKAVEAAEAAIALEKRSAQKEKVEADICFLNEEKEALASAVEGLKREREELTGQTKRLTREVAKLETALNIRQEEMRDMESRAQKLERRILEGVMDHARTMNISKSVGRKKTTTPAERDAAMSLKRVPSSASTVTTKTSVRDGNSALGNAVTMALKKRAPLGSAANSTVSSRSSGVGRRILSTSHVIGNRGREVPDRALMLAPTSNTDLVNVKRSHSVKSNPSSYYGGRKASWSGVGSDISTSTADKENQVLNEEDEEEDMADSASDTGTERRTSVGNTSLMYTDSLTYGTGSYLGTEGARTASYASSTCGAIGGKAEGIAEEDEAEHEEQGLIEGFRDETQHQLLIEGSPDHEPNQEEESAKILALLDAPATKAEEEREDIEHEGDSMALVAFEGAGDDSSDLKPPKLITGNNLDYHQSSDSGLGTEPPTADVEGSGLAQEYFGLSRRDYGVGVEGGH